MTKKIFKLNKKFAQGIKTLLSVEKKSYDQLITSKITKNFIILHFGLGIEDDFETLKKFLHEIPSIKSPFLIDIYPGYPHGFLEFTDIEDSQNLVETLKALNQEEENPTKPNYKNSNSLQTDKEIYLRTTQLNFEAKTRNVFFLSTELNKEDMFCAYHNANSLQSATRDYKQFEKIGLIVLPELISENEEKNLFEQFKNNPWENLNHRRVQHFGFKFIYGQNSVNKNNEMGTLPNWLTDPFMKPSFQKHFPIEQSFFDQCTVNEYKPGSGIPPHCDSHGPFEELLVSISLFSDIVMQFYNPLTQEKFSVLIPKRSAFALTGEIRYLWKHSIADRKLDRVDNDLVFRRTRLSLTFRKTKPALFCACPYPKFCDYQVVKEDQKISSDVMGKTEFENTYVKNVYNSIAEHFSHTRYKAWPSVQEFLESLPKNSFIGDIGCGNGKYMFCTEGLQFIGTDIAFKFVEIVKEKDRNMQVAVADTTVIPFRSQSLDYAISIAVIHHLSSDERRIQALKELLRIVKIGGEILVYVWAFEQEKDYGGVDVFVPWNNQKKFENENGQIVEDKKLDENKNTIVYKRYYHLFKKGELEKIAQEAAYQAGNEIDIKDSYYSHQNWAVRIRKLKQLNSKLS